MAKHKPADTAPKLKVTDLVKARVLIDCAYGRCDAVVELTEEDAAIGAAAGCIDCHPEAVAYAESLIA